MWETRQTKNQQFFLDMSEKRGHRAKLWIGRYKESQLTRAEACMENSARVEKPNL